MRPSVIALVPAHNEEAGIVKTVEALQSQTRKPARIIVIADNCTDRTHLLAQKAGAEVFETVNNGSKKAGALNQALAAVLPSLSASDAVLVQDADTDLASTFIETALAKLGGDVGAIGGSFYARHETNWLQVMQGNEYGRYVREISRRKDARANVLTGAGSVFRVDVLREVAEARRSGQLPGSGVYKHDALTEDNELTLAIRRLGYKVVSPKACAIHTDAPETWHSLFEQRLRWRRGAMEDLLSHGLCKTTAPYLLKMAWSLFVTILSFAYIYLVTGAIAIGSNPFIFKPFWIAVFAIYVADRWWTVRGRSLKAQALALLFPAEIIYDLFQQAVLLRALWDFARRSEQRWVHV